MGRCCDYCDLKSHDRFPDAWPGPGRFRDPGCVGLVSVDESPGGPVSSSAYHTNPYHPRGWWVPIPPASIGLPPPTNVRTETSLYRRSTATLDVRIKLLLDTDLYVEDVPEGAERDKLLAKFGSLKAGSPIDFPNWEFFRATRKFKWHGSVKIRTIYRKKGMAEGYSCYGRGTTGQDVIDGRITLGFHEWCHQQFFAKYLTDRPFPLPKLRAGMTDDEFKKAKAVFEKAAADYSSTIVKENETAVDEVGYTKSKWKQTSACFGHKLPLTKKP